MFSKDIDPNNNEKINRMKKDDCMKIFVEKTSEDLGRKAADIVADEINKAIKEKGSARIILSTGASQFTTLENLVKRNIRWDCVTMFHLDEYIGLSETHAASFRKYLKERFVNLIHPKEAFFVNGEGDVSGNITALTKEIRKEPIDVALIGIGENSHIAFNDPPADFNTTEAYIIVNLDDNCKRQQMGEGWFATVEDVPKQAVSMTVYQMMQAKVIISCVPGERKAEAVKKTLTAEKVTPVIPATMLREHSNWMLFLDEGSASLTDKSLL
jgi:glucosamine-6-phosphate deaminase